MDTAVLFEPFGLDGMDAGVRAGLVRALGQNYRRWTDHLREVFAGEQVKVSDLLDGVTPVDVCASDGVDLARQLDEMAADAKPAHAGFSARLTRWADEARALAFDRHDGTLRVTDMRGAW